MSTEQVQEAQVVEAEAVNPSLEAVTLQRANFVSQLEQVKKDMNTLQQQFENKKVLGIKLEAGIETLDLLAKTLSK